MRSKKYKIVKTKKNIKLGKIKKKYNGKSLILFLITGSCRMRDVVVIVGLM